MWPDQLPSRHGEAPQSPQVTFGTPFFWSTGVLVLFSILSCAAPAMFIMLDICTQPVVGRQPHAGRLHQPGAC